METPLQKALAELRQFFDRLQSVSPEDAMFLTKREVATREVATQGIFAAMNMIIMAAGTEEKNWQEVHEFVRPRLEVYQATTIPKGMLTILDETSKLFCGS